MAMLAPAARRIQNKACPTAGLGSGTQLALAVGHAFARWQRLDPPSATIARWLGRGARSGIGIAGFDAGGLLLDAGPGPAGEAPTLLARTPLPSRWRVIVVQDAAMRGLEGAAEREALARLAPFTRAQAAEVCHQVLMRVLPGAARAEFAAFAQGVARIQELLGEHFAPAQGGGAWTSPAVGQALFWMRRAAGASIAIGQSSWGPTGFGFVPSRAAADELLDAARANGVLPPSLRADVVAPRNHGATIATTARRGELRRDHANANDTPP